MVNVDSGRRVRIWYLVYVLRVGRKDVIDRLRGLGTPVKANCKYIVTVNSGRGVQDVEYVLRLPSWRIIASFEDNMVNVNSGWRVQNIVYVELVGRTDVIDRLQGMGTPLQADCKYAVYVNSGRGVQDMVCVLLLGRQDVKAHLRGLGTPPISEL